MYYFAYGSNMFTYRLEKRIGKVQVIGIASLPKYKLALHKVSKDGSTKANAFYTGKQEDILQGILFDIDETRKPKLDKEEGLGKGYHEAEVNVLLIGTETEVQAFTYIADTIDESGEILPYDWYMDFIVAGAEEHHLSDAYIKLIKSLPYSTDSDMNRASLNRYIIKEAGYIRKSLSPFFASIAEMEKSKDVEIQIAGSVFNKRIIKISKTDGVFEFQTTTVIEAGKQTHKELSVRGKHLNLSEKNDVKWVVDGKHFLINNIGYDHDNMVKVISGEINAFATSLLKDDDRSYYRLAIPSKNRLRLERDFFGLPFICDYRLFGGLIKVSISGNEFQLFQVEKDGIYYIFIDVLHEIPFKDFQVSANCVLMSYAFLCGYYPGEEGYFFSCKDSNLTAPTNTSFFKLGEGVEDQYIAFTTNPYWGIDMESRDLHHEGAEEERGKLYGNINPIAPEVFARICELAYTDDHLQRAMVLLIRNQNATLEIKIPTQYVTIEAIANALSKNNKSLKPIEDDMLAKKLISQLSAVVDAFIAENPTLTKDALSPYYRKIEAINAPPNVDKLSKAFEIVGYTVSSEEKKILNDRNRYLHGGAHTFGSMEKDFKEFFS
ncbi:gamma-glutamylcyclotransferase [Chitinophaga horti]|uniref:Gamma-glutamylcyclotransferase n=1 Tax=Chitinophaga horti TaxID=2920382 RepID=A0ABY6IZK2_9BACT|nr:gamma-glutamylcyclotransferase family protein [Chitinophaga horti]UYQ92839.1 gamma-glutamylcyclotransferase [Chitinophaga horti]